MKTQQTLSLLVIALALISGCSKPDELAPESQSSTQSPSQNADQDVSADESVAQEPASDTSLDDQSTQTNDEPGNASTVNAMLRQQMITVTSQIMKQQNPSLSDEDIVNQVDNGIANLRKQDPSFLVLSTEAEARLKAGDLRQDSIARIDTALKFLTEYEIKFSGLSNALLEQHQTGELSKEATELLAHLLVAQVKQARKALGG